MDKFIYAVCEKDVNKVKTISATTVKDAKDRIIRKYWDRYEDLECDVWEDFIDEICDKHVIMISPDILMSEEI